MLMVPSAGVALAKLLEDTKDCCLQQLDLAENDLGRAPSPRAQ